MNRVVLDLQNENDVLLLLALAERLSATIVEVSPISNILKGKPQYQPLSQVVQHGNYDKTKFLQAVNCAKSNQVFNNISNAVQWQQTLRNEWE